MEKYGRQLVQVYSVEEDVWGNPLVLPTLNGKCKYENMVSFQPGVYMPVFDSLVTSVDISDIY
jgi:hypothetical protein